jgi:hypothetical protein
MKVSLRKWVVVAALMGCCVTASRAQQGRFDPEEMRQRMIEQMRERFEVTDDAEWKIIQGKIEKVMEARRASGGGAFGFAAGGGGFAGRRGGGDGAAGGGERGDRGARRFGGLGGEPLPEAEELRKSIEAKASADEIKAKLAKLREARKAGEAKLEVAQEDLRKVLSVRQEAVAVMAGLLK